jgi:hypothetical protein
MQAPLQREWVTALYAGQSVPPGLRDSVSERRFAVYRASLMANLAQALASTFPVVHRLTGAEFFETAAHRYIALHPSHNGDIHAYGIDFPGFLASFEPAHTLEYLPDVAHLEWLAHEAFHAADAETVALAQLVDVHPDIRLRLHPSLRLLRTEWAAHLIWQANQPHEPGGCELLPRGEYLLAVFRDDEQVAVLPLEVAEHDYWSRLMAGEPMGDALIHTLDRYADFDAGASLYRLFMHGLVAERLTHEETF